MNISVIGSGYVGLVAAACFSEMGNNVRCVDIDEVKIDNLRKGIIPIYEPGLSDLILKNFQKGHISFTTSLKEAILDCEIIFIAVGTPMGEDGSADLQYVKTVAKDIGKLIQSPVIIVDKSTVPVGTADTVREIIQNQLNERNVHVDFDVVSNPEFLKEGAAIEDFMKPDRVVVGANNTNSMLKMKELYAPFLLSHDRFIEMDVRSAEMTKYAANAMLATKISFINEIANICEKVGADINNVRIGIGSDSRIGYKFIYPGCGYGGSCFPKDVRALVNIANKNNYKAELISAVESVNNRQKLILTKKVQEEFGNNLNGLTFAIWGLSFKPETDDMREAPSIEIVKYLHSKGASINAYDPKAVLEAKHYLKDIPVNYFDDKYDVLNQVDSLILITEWKEFRSPDFAMVKSLMKGNVIFDGRNQFQKDKLDKSHLKYHQIGKAL